MYLGGKSWRGVTIEVLSNREVKYDTSKYSGAMTQGLIPLRDAVEVVLRDLIGGGSTMTIIAPKQTYELRSNDGSVLHTLNRRLTPLFQKASQYLLPPVSPSM